MSGCGSFRLVSESCFRFCVGFGEQIADRGRSESARKQTEAILEGPAVDEQMGSIVFRTFVQASMKI